MFSLILIAIITHFKPFPPMMPLLVFSGNVQQVRCWSASGFFKEAESGGDLPSSWWNLWHRNQAGNKVQFKQNQFGTSSNFFPLIRPAILKILNLYVMKDTFSGDFSGPVNFIWEIRKNCTGWILWTGYWILSMLLGLMSSGFSLWESLCFQFTKI